MEKEFSVCLLCLKVVPVNVFKQFDPSMKKDMLLIVYPQLKVFSIENLINCCDCEQLLNAMFNFKCSCLDIDDYLQNFIDCDNRIDMDMVLFDINGIQIVSDNSNVIKEKLCRLCLGSIEGDSFNTDVDESVKVMLKTCLPEVNLKLTNTSMFCYMCLERLQIQYNFINRVATLEQTLNSYGEDQISKFYSFDMANNIINNIIKEKEDKRGAKDEQRYQINNIIKEEELKQGTKDEQRYQTSNNSLCDIANNTEKMSGSKAIIGEREGDEVSNINLFSAASSTEQMFNLRANEKEKWKGKNLENNGESHSGNTNSIEIEKRTQTEDLITNKKSSPVKEKLTETEVKVAQRFRCSECSYKSKEESCLKLHMLLTHSNVNDMISIKTSNEVKTYVCNECNFESTRDYALWSHILIHKNKEPEIFKCKGCGYECSTSSTLGRHMRIHKAKAKEQFSCSQCPYITSLRNSFFNHFAAHVGAATRASDEKGLYTMYKCTLCSHKLKACHVDKHFLRHLRQNYRVFECKMCLYQSNIKLRLKLHELDHARGLIPEPSNFFRCRFCGCETESIRKNFLVHGNRCLETKMRKSRESLFRPGCFQKHAD